MAHQNPKSTLIESPLVGDIVTAFFRVYDYYGFGLLESIYSAALASELVDMGHSVRRESRIVIEYKGKRIGHHRLDMIVDGRVIVESKASAALAASTEQQVLSYLNATTIEVALLLHFGPKAHFKKYVSTLDGRRRGPHGQRVARNN